MCVPVPVKNNAGQNTVNKGGEVTKYGLPNPSRNVFNQMMIPFQAATTAAVDGKSFEKQQKAFNDPDSIAAMLAQPTDEQQSRWRRPY
jgi:hypothetical protein